MTVRRATKDDLPAIDKLLTSESADRSRFTEIIRAAVDGANNEYVTCVAVNPGGVEGLAAYGMIAGTVGTGALYGVSPLSAAQAQLLTFAQRDLGQLGAKRIVAEFPDTDAFKPYRNSLLSYGYGPVGRVDDFYRDGVALLIFVRQIQNS